jgi:hypothetical protein
LTLGQKSCGGKNMLALVRIDPAVLIQFNEALGTLIRARRDLEAYRQRHSMLHQSLQDAARAAHALAERIASEDERLKQFLRDAGLEDDLPAPV